MKFQSETEQFTLTAEYVLMLHSTTQNAHMLHQTSLKCEVEEELQDLYE